VQEIEALAILSVRRACGFAALGIATLMFGFIGTPATAFGSGAVCCLLAALILYWKGEHATRTDHRRTELWMMLAKSHRPPHDVAIVVVPRILQQVYRDHCRWAVAAAAGLALPAIGLHLAD
jgi:hypothetical protein